MAEEKTEVEQSRKIWGELFLDADGTAHFKWHIEGGGFRPAREALKKFIALLQERLDNEKRCPFYQPE